MSRIIKSVLYIPAFPLVVLSLFAIITLPFIVPAIVIFSFGGSIDSIGSVLVFAFMTYFIALNFEEDLKELLCRWEKMVGWFSV